MKIIISILLIALVSFALGLYLPWWSIAIPAFGIAALLIKKPWVGFIAGFTSIFLLWGGLSLGISAANKHLLATKISVLVINNNNPLLLILMTALAGALVAGFAALSGSLFRRLL